MGLPATSAGYTAILRGTDNGTGIGVEEAFDLDSAVDSKLANISTRGLVQTGDNLLIARGVNERTGIAVVEVFALNN